jgi:hypothetical protein
MHVIIVSNIGTVYTGTREDLAAAKWNEYVRQSRESSGRASGETVTWMENDEVRCQSEGSLYINTEEL